MKIQGLIQKRPSPSQLAHLYMNKTLKAHIQNTWYSKSNSVSFMNKI